MSHGRDRAANKSHRSVGSRQSQCSQLWKNYRRTQSYMTNGSQGRFVPPPAALIIHFNQRGILHQFTTMLRETLTRCSLSATRRIVTRCSARSYIRASRNTKSAPSCGAISSRGHAQGPTAPSPAVSVQRRAFLFHHVQTIKCQGVHLYMRLALQLTKPRSSMNAQQEKRRSYRMYLGGL